MARERRVQSARSNDGFTPITTPTPTPTPRHAPHHTCAVDTSKSLLGLFGLSQGLVVVVVVVSSAVGDRSTSNSSS
jgi:hypothetical protein